MPKKNVVQTWERRASEALVGKRVKSVRYLSKEEVGALGWCASALVLEFEDGTLVFPSRDDEGNGAGALFGQGPKDEELTFPTISSYLMDRPAITGLQLSGPDDSQTSRSSSTKEGAPSSRFANLV